MANVDIEFGGTATRPRAFIEAYRATLVEEQPARRPPPPPAPPRFSRVDTGQLIRALILVVVCLGFAQLPHVDGAGDKRAVAAVVTPKPI